MSGFWACIVNHGYSNSDFKGEKKKVLAKKREIHTQKNQQVQILPSKTNKHKIAIAGFDQWTGLRFSRVLLYSRVAQVVHSALGTPAQHLNNQCSPTSAPRQCLSCLNTALALHTSSHKKSCLELFQQAGYQGSPRAWRYWFICGLIGFFLHPINPRLYQ